MLTIAFIIVSGLSLAAAGAWRASSALEQHRDLSLRTAQNYLPELYFIVPLSVAGVVSMVVSHTNKAILWHVPLWLDPFSMPLIWLFSGGAFAYLFAVGAVVAYRTGHQERRGILVAAVLLGAVLGTVQIVYNKPIWNTLEHKVSRSGFILQSGGASCVAASAANIVRHFGGEATEREMAEIAGTTLRGTSPGQLVEALDEKGIKAKKRTLDVAALVRLQNPAVLLVDVPGRGPDAHAVVFLPRVENAPRDHVTVVDPLTGKMTLPADQFAREGWWGGHLLECQPVGIPARPADGQGHQR